MEIKVGELIKKAKIQRCGEGNYPVLSMTMHDGLVFQEERFKKQIASIDQSNYQIVKRHQLVESFPIDEGVLAVQELTEEGIVSPAYKIWDVDIEKVIPEYLEYALRSHRSIEYYKSKLRGTTARRRSITDDEFSAMLINYPDVEKQREIIKIIAGIKRLLSKRNHELETLDDLIKARFVELFGDLRINPQGWSIQTFDELSELITDGEHATPKRTSEGIYLLSARNVLNHAIQLNDVDYIDQEEYDRISKRIVPKEGDVLISCSGSVGRCCSVPEGLKFQMVRSAALIRFKKVISPLFAEYMITSDFVQEQINASKTASSQANLFQGKIAKLKGFVPPVELQNEFTTFVKQVDKSKVAIQKSLEKMQLLFDSLMQKYFC